MNEQPVIIDGSQGIDNRNRAEVIDAKHLRYATNIDINTNKTKTRRAGYDLKISGNYKCLWSNRNYVLGLKNGDLYSINTTAWTELLVEPDLGDLDISFVDINGVPFLTNGQRIGYVSSNLFYDFPQLTSAVRNKLKGQLPAGSILEFYKSRLYVAVGDVIYISDVGKFYQYHLQKGFKRMDGEVVMMKAVDKGLWVSTRKRDAIYWMAIDQPDVVGKTTLVWKDEYAAKKGMVSPRKFGVRLPGLATPVNGIFFVTDNGVCFGSDEGDYRNFTKYTYKPVTGEVGTSMVRTKDDGTIQFVSVIKT